MLHYKIRECYFSIIFTYLVNDKQPLQNIVYKEKSTINVSYEP